MEDIMREYPYMEVFGFGDDSYHTDEHAEQEEEQANMKIYLEKMNSKIKVISESVKQIQYTIGVQTEPNQIEKAVKD